jgi:hypothetical protein
MTSAPKLGGFKVLKGVNRISFALPQSRSLPELLRLIAAEKINLPYFTCVQGQATWGLHLVVESVDRDRTVTLIERSCGIPPVEAESVILSVFPHRSDPTIAARLLGLFNQEGLALGAVGNSPSAISVVLDKGLLSKAGSALFDVFQFSAYRTPSDWKLAQKGREKLYKEVVASYQEQRPKTYGLEIADQHDFVCVRLDGGDLASLGPTLHACSQHGLNLTFLSLGPPNSERDETLAFCLPGSSAKACATILNRLCSENALVARSQAAVFTMNGPHFGDRHGIASELLNGFEEHHVDLLGLSCTIASVTGVVPSSQLDSAVKAIRSSFEVPGVVTKA